MWSLLTIAGLFPWLALGCNSDPAPFPSADELSAIQSLRKIHIPPSESTNAFADSAAAAALGEQLFNDAGFSSCGDRACAQCHPPPSYTIALPLAGGCNGTTTRNVISLLNVPFNDWFYWDGRKDSLWAHPLFPLLDHIEMDATPTLVRQRLTSTYAQAYAEAFGSSPADEADDNRLLANFGKAIDAFLRRATVRVDAPFDDALDRFLTVAQAGRAASDPLYPGLQVFVRAGHCIICHKGPMLSDGSFHNIGVRQAVPIDHGRRDGLRLLDADIWNGASIYSDDRESGAAKLSTPNALSDAELDGLFKTASLRNIALTAPYMHTGQLATLRDVIEFYNRGGDPVGSFPGTRAVTIVPLHLSEPQKEALEQLLMSLTGREQLSQ
jgi:cytochrome c peroxidase